MKRQRPTKALIDGDILLYRAGFASQTTEKGTVVDVRPEEEASSILDYSIESIKKKLKIDDFKIFVSDATKSNFRYKIATTKPYKGNRTSGGKPVHYEYLRKYVLRNYFGTASEVRGAEVDDAISITQDKIEGSTVIVSSDKDLLMVPGWNFDLDVGRVVNYGDKSYKMKAYKSNAVTFVTDPGQLFLTEGNNNRKVLYGTGQMWFCSQLLTGDSCDNIVGLSKIGPVTAYETLKDVKTYEEAVTKVYDKYVEQGVEGRFLEIATLLWIKRVNGKETFLPESIMRRVNAV